MIRQYYKYFFVSAAFLVLVSVSSIARSQDKIELKTIQIKGNKELPKILYVVPWRDAGQNEKRGRKIKLHNFFGELYQPLTPAPPKLALDEALN